VVTEIFDQIASGWYNFRHWSIFPGELAQLARRWQQGRLLNIGCAHGPDFLPFREGFELYGIDSSGEMLKLARRYAEKFNLTVDLTLADARQLPYPDESFNWVISIATYHHVKGEGERLKALKELKRVLKPGGEAFITVWNRWQPRFWFRGREIAEPWRTKEKTLYRYYHLFSYRELEKLVKEAGMKILKSTPESSYRFPVKFFSRNVCLLTVKSE
jgi:ubiquinone/menaquinone biosynthesis C-methylase UbiE